MTSRVFTFVLTAITFLFVPANGFGAPKLIPLAAENFAASAKLCVSGGGGEPQDILPLLVQLDDADFRVREAAEE